MWSSSIVRRCALVTREGATSLVVRSDLLALFVAKNKPKLAEPAFNIQAGLAYLYERMALSDNTTSIRDAKDTEEHKHVVVKGENADKIARHEGTTLEELQASNPDVDLVHVELKQELLYHKASKPLRITGWLTFDADTIAKRYNGGGDPDYAEKLRYVVGKLTEK